MNLETVRQAVIVEVTGMPGAGKSTIIEALARPCADPGPKRRVFSDTWSNGRSLWESIRFECRLWNELIRCRPLSARQVQWLWRQSGRARVGVALRLNIFRNCLLKFAYRPVIENSIPAGDAPVYVDEGISHIPFLLQRLEDGCAVVEGFVREFGDGLRGVRVLFVDADPDDVRSRLRARSHKRLRPGDEPGLNRFVDICGRTAACIQRNRDVYQSFEIVWNR